jgi:hypothetical protein
MASKATITSRITPSANLNMLSQLASCGLAMRLFLFFRPLAFFLAIASSLFIDRTKGASAEVLKVAKPRAAAKWRSAAK